MRAERAVVFVPAVLVAAGSALACAPDGDGALLDAGPARYESVEVRRIGQVEGEEPYLFGDVVGLYVTPDDTVLVANGQSRTVRIFAPDGRFVREFAGRGDGPAELPSFTVLRGGGRVIVTDYRKAVAFTTSGEHLATARTTGPDGEPMMPLARQDGAWISLVYDVMDYMAAHPPGSQLEWERRIVLASDDGSLHEQVIALPPWHLFASPAASSETGGASPRPHLLDPELQIGVDGRNRFYIPSTDRYRIEVFDPGGERVRVVEREHEPVAVTEAELEAFVDRAVGYLDNESLRPDFMARVENRIRDHRPPLGRLLVSPDGSFWIERLDRVSLVESELRGGRPQMGIDDTHWDLFDAGGELLGSAVLPASFTPMAVRGRFVTGVERDDLDVEYVVTRHAREAGS